MSKWWFLLLLGAVGCVDGYASSVSKTTDTAPSQSSLQTNWAPTFSGTYYDGIFISYKSGGDWTITMTTLSTGPIRVFDLALGGSDITNVVTTIPPDSAGNSAAAWWYVSGAPTSTDDSGVSDVADAAEVSLDTAVATDDATADSLVVDSAEAGVQTTDDSSATDSVTDTGLATTAILTTVRVSADQAANTAVTFSFHMTPGHPLTLDARVDGYDSPALIYFHDPAVAYTGSADLSTPSSLPVLFTPSIP